MDLKIVWIAIGWMSAGSAMGQASATAARPDFRLSYGYLSGEYDDATKNEVKETSGEQSGVKLTGSEVQVAGAWRNFDAELTSRTLQPKDVDYWSKRGEIYFTLGYYWPSFSYVQPVVGYHQMTQSGDLDAEDAPTAFIDKNKAFVLGLRSSFSPYNFGTHGPVVQIRQSYITSLEAKRNFGDERYLGLGYYFQTGRFKAGIAFGQLRNFFHASKPSEEDEELRLKVRHEYTANRVGLYIEY